MIKEINKCNWTGEKAKITINKSKRTVSVYDGQDVFKIKKQKYEIEKGVFETYYEAFWSQRPDSSFCSIDIMSDGSFSAVNDICSRESKCMYEAVAKLAFNLI